MLKNVFILPNVLYAAVTYCNVKRSEKTFVTEDSKKPVIHNPCCNEICQTLWMQSECTLNDWKGDRLG